MVAKAGREEFGAAVGATVGAAVGPAEGSEGGAKGGAGGGGTSGGAGGHTDCDTRYFTSRLRLVPSQCVRPKKQHPLDVTLSSAHSPSAKQACSHSSRLAPHTRQPLFSSRYSSDGRPRLMSVATSAEV